MWLLLSCLGMFKHVWERHVVIALNAKKVDDVHSWAMHLGVPYVLQPPSVMTSHDIGESLSYAEYIIHNYYHLANYTIFLCDANMKHWHRPSNWLQSVIFQARDHEGDRKISTRPHRVKCQG